MLGKVGVFSTITVGAFSLDIHKVLLVYNECHGQNHKKQIEDLDDKLVLLAAELRKYHNRFGIIKD